MNICWTGDNNILEHTPNVYEGQVRLEYILYNYMKSELLR